VLPSESNPIQLGAPLVSQDLRSCPRVPLVITRLGGAASGDGVSLPVQGAATTPSPWHGHAAAGIGRERNARGAPRWRKDFFLGLQLAAFTARARACSLGAGAEPSNLKIGQVSVSLACSWAIDGSPLVGFVSNCTSDSLILSILFGSSWEDKVCD
jgi:hypothetical protein